MTPRHAPSGPARLRRPTIIILAATALLLTAPIASAHAPHPDPDCDGVANIEAHTDGETIVLNWDSYPNATSYKIHRADDSGPMQFLAEVDAETTTYTDADVEVGTTYHYGVTAVHPFGERLFETQNCEHVHITAIPVFPSLLAGLTASLVGIGAYVISRRGR